MKLPITKTSKGYLLELPESDFSEALRQENDVAFVEVRIDHGQVVVESAASAEKKARLDQAKKDSLAAYSSAYKKLAE